MGLLYANGLIALLRMFCGPELLTALPVACASHSYSPGVVSKHTPLHV